MESSLTITPNPIPSTKESSVIITENNNKTRNTVLIKKLEKSLNTFIRNNKSSVTLSGTKRFSDKTGIYYLKNKKAKPLVQNYLTPIPTMNKKKIKNHFEKSTLHKAERTAVCIRRLEYSFGIKQNKINERNIKIRNKKIIRIQQWWKMLYRVIIIQKNIRGYLIRKKVIDYLEYQGTLLNNFLFLRSICDKYLMKKTLYLLKSLFLKEKIIMGIITKTLKKIDNIVLLKKFIFWKLYKSKTIRTINKPRIIEEFIKEIEVVIRKCIFHKIKRIKKRRFRSFIPITAKTSRRTISCENVKHSSNVIKPMKSYCMKNTGKSFLSKLNVSSEKKKNRYESCQTINIKVKTPKPTIGNEEHEEKIEKAYVATQALMPTKSKRKMIYSNQISKQNKEEKSKELILFHQCKYSEKCQKSNLLSLNKQIEICNKKLLQRKKIQRYNQQMLHKYFDIWKKNIPKKNKINVVYISKKNSHSKSSQKQLKKPKIVKKYINIGTSLLFFAFIRWKTNVNTKPLFNLTLFSLINSVIKKLREKKLQKQIQSLNTITNTLNKHILLNTIKKWKQVKVIQEKTIHFRTKSALYFPLELLLDSQDNTPLRSSLQFPIPSTTPNTVLCYRKKILNVNYNYTNPNNLTTFNSTSSVDFDPSEDRFYYN